MKIIEKRCVFFKLNFFDVRHVSEDVFLSNIKYFCNGKTHEEQQFSPNKL